MKLYATVTSERATKGQGGNLYIEGKVLSEDRATKLLHYFVKPKDDYILVHIIIAGYEPREYQIEVKR